MSLSAVHQFLRRVVLTQLPLFTMRSKNVYLTSCLLSGQFHSNKLCTIHQTQTCKIAHVISVNQFRTYSYSERSETEDLDMNGPEQSGRKKKYKLMEAKKRTRNDQREAEECFQRMMDDSGKSEWSAVEWAEACDTLNPRLRSPWDIMCMRVLHSTNDVQMAKSLIGYLESLTTPVNRVVLAYYVSLLGKTSVRNKEQQDLLWRYYQTFVSENELIDSISTDLLIEGLCHTHHYLEGLSLLEKQRNLHETTLGILMHLLLGALRHNDTTVCKQMLEEIKQTGVDPPMLSSFVPRIVQACLDAGNESGLDLVMSFMEKMGILISKDNLDKIADHFHSHQPGLWVANYSYIHKRGGNCLKCGHLMDRPEVTDEEFEALKNVFHDQVIVGGNIFFRSSPEEVKRFCKYVAAHGPFDIVIDGLNVLYNRRAPKISSLVCAIQHYSDLGYRVLVLGSTNLKYHMATLNRIQPKPFVYLTTTTKADDVFFLYAALFSGKSTIILTHDKLRDHRFKLEPQLRPVFTNWLHTVQIFDWFIPNNGQFVAKPGRSFKLGPTRDAGGWHFPLDDYTSEHAFGQMGVLCLRRKSSPSFKIGRPRRDTELMYMHKEKERGQEERELEKAHQERIRKKEYQERMRRKQQRQQIRKEQRERRWSEKEGFDM